MLARDTAVAGTGLGGWQLGGSRWPGELPACRVGTVPGPAGPCPRGAVEIHWWHWWHWWRAQGHPLGTTAPNAPQLPVPSLMPVPHWGSPLWCRRYRDGFYTRGIVVVHIRAPQVPGAACGPQPAGTGTPLGTCIRGGLCVPAAFPKPTGRARGARGAQPAPAQLPGDLFSPSSYAAGIKALLPLAESCHSRHCGDADLGSPPASPLPS